MLRDQITFVCRWPGSGPGGCWDRGAVLPSRRENGGKRLWLHPVLRAKGRPPGLPGEGCWSGMLSLEEDAMAARGSSGLPGEGARGTPAVSWLRHGVCAGKRFPEPEGCSVPLRQALRSSRAPKMLKAPSPSPPRAPIAASQHSGKPWRSCPCCSVAARSGGVGAVGGRCLLRGGAEAAVGVLGARADRETLNPCEMEPSCAEIKLGKVV